MSVLYITYDGLLDPLGGSQILPYIKGISLHQDRIIVLSFEKKDRLKAGHQIMRSSLEADGIYWKAVPFTYGLGVIGKAWDFWRMYYWAFYLSYRYRVRIVHGRSHTSTQVGYFIKRILKSKLLFDFRGLWVDERVDKGGWDLKNKFDLLQYNCFKKVENILLSEADEIVVLTEKVVKEVVNLGAKPASKVTIIPCCADFDHFYLSTELRKNEARIYIGIPSAAVVLGYSGSVGEMYMLDRFFRLFELAASKNMKYHAFLVTQDIFELQQLIEKCLPAFLHKRVHIKSASRNEIPNLLTAMDVLVSFIAPSYARMGASPTKLAESFSVGIPVICNHGVGDVSQIVQDLDAGLVIDLMSDEELSKTAQQLNKIRSLGGQRLRDVARPYFGLEVAFQRYRDVYTKLN